MPSLLAFDTARVRFSAAADARHADPAAHTSTHERNQGEMDDPGLLLANPHRSTRRSRHFYGSLGNP